MSDKPSERLFSYGTLQLEPVQKATFGRSLSGKPDALVGFRQSRLRIEDPEVIRLSGKSEHIIVEYTGANTDTVGGVVFEVSMQEVQNADKYEVAAYVRVAVELKSGVRSWVYVDKRFAPPNA